MPHPFLGIGFTSPLFSKFFREETEELLELTTKSDTTSYQINVTSSGSTWTYKVDWGDGNIENFTESNTGSSRPSHTYSSAGVYEIKFTPTGSTTTLFFNTQSGERSKITMVDGVGSSEWTSFGTAGNLFTSHVNITSISSSLDTSNCAIWYGAFYLNDSLTPFPLLDTSSATNIEYALLGCTSLTSFPLIDTSNVTTMKQTWQGCINLTSFPPIDTSSVVNTGGDGTSTGFYFTWYNCTGLTSFPVIDTSNATQLPGTWDTCSGLTSFPVIDTSNVTNMQQTWQNCSGLTSFPILNYTNVTSFLFAWRNCSSLTSFTGAFGAGLIRFGSAWNGCTALADFSANAFDNVDADNTHHFYLSFTNCPNLTPQSIENILVSLETSGAINASLGLGGTTPGESTWTSAAVTAKASLVSRGWTIDSNA